MGLNKSKGNMYDWVTHTWSPITGCAHQCEYCYVKTFRKLPAAPEINFMDFIPLGKGNTIFVGHMCDMFGSNVPSSWIRKVIAHCAVYPGNKYVFQTKNPQRMFEFDFMPTRIFGTTIETNRADILSKISQAPPPEDRAAALSVIKHEKFLTIEPIMDFDVEPFVSMIKLAHPDFVNIGADSKGHGLPEPTFEKVQWLIDELSRAGITVRKKTNLWRLR